MLIARFPCLAASLAVGLLMGCSDSSIEGRKAVYETSGTITMNGGPVANAAVTFSPVEGQPVATGRTDANGVYQLTTYEGYDGAAEGEFIVLVTKSLGGGGGGDTVVTVDDPNYGEAPMHAAAAEETSDSGLPERYGNASQSDLTATVTPDGDNVFDFNLVP